MLLYDHNESLPRNGEYEDYQSDGESGRFSA